MGGKVNRKAVRRAIASGEVTGANVRRLTFSVLAELRAHPCHYGKVFEILKCMIDAGEVKIHDAVPHFSDPKAKMALLDRKRRARQRSNRRRRQRFVGGESVAHDQSWSSQAIPVEWIGCNPDDYASPTYGWRGVRSSEASRATRQANEAARQRALDQAMLEQFEDWLCDGMTPEHGHEDDIRLGLGFSIPA